MDDLNQTLLGISNILMTELDNQINENYQGTI